MARKPGIRAAESQGLLLRHKPAQGLTAGLDEAGRGCLAGPVVSGAVIFADGFDLVGLGDSKSIAEPERTRLAGEIRDLALGWGIGIAWTGDIARHNILQASLLSMARALAALRVRMGWGPDELNPARLLIDGNQVLPLRYFSLYAIPTPAQESIVGGDASVPCISAASILAKTFRDELMIRLDRRWPEYGFARHKGYGTREHREVLKRHGPCPIHRLEFRGVRPGTALVQGTLL